MTIKHLFPPAWPVIDFNFAMERELDPLIAFSRSSTATYLDQAGVLQTAQIDEPRFEFINGVSKGLMVEEGSTNVYSISEDYASWDIVNSGGTASVDGTTIAGLQAVKLTASTATNSLALQYSGGLTANTTYTVSVFYKPGQVSAGQDSLWVEARFFDDGGTGKLWFNPSTGLWNLPGGAGWSTFAYRVQNGWRVGYTFDVGTDAAGWVRIGGISSYLSTDVVPGDYGYLAGPQIEAKGQATSYIPTNGATANRDEDICTANTGDLISDEFTIISEPFGCCGGSDTLYINGYPYVERIAVYNQVLSQDLIEAVTNSTDDGFWRIRVLGASVTFAGFGSDGQITVDWGDGTVETFPIISGGIPEHTFTNGAGWHEVGFRMDSGTWLRPVMQSNPVYAMGPTPKGMTFSPSALFQSIGSTLRAWDATATLVGGSTQQLITDAQNLGSMPYVDTSATPGPGSLSYSFRNLKKITRFPLIDTSMISTFGQAWIGCGELKRFPAIDTSSGTLFNSAWGSCSKMESFPWINTSQATAVNSAWANCSALLSFPKIDTSNVTSFNAAWYKCTSLTSFPDISTDSGEDFASAWNGCTGLTTMPALNYSNATTLYYTFYACSALTTINVATINAPNCADMTAMFLLCGELLTVPEFIVPSVTTLNSAFKSCSKLTNIKVTTGPSLVNCNYAFAGTDISSIDLFDTSGVTNFNYMFYGCASLTTVPAFDFSSATSMQSTFESTNISAMPTLNIPDCITLQNAFYKCSNITAFVAPTTTSALTGLQSAFRETGITSIGLFDTSGVESWTNTFRQTPITTVAALDMSSATDMNGAFLGCAQLVDFPNITNKPNNCNNFYSFLQSCTSLKTFPPNFFDNWNPQSMAINCLYNFCYDTTSLEITSVNNILDSLVTSGVSYTGGGNPAINSRITIGYDINSSGTINTASVNTLKSRNWTVYLNNVQQ